MIPCIARRSLFLELLRTNFNSRSDLSSSTCCEMKLSCADRSVALVNPSPNDWRTLGNHFAIDRRLVGYKVPIDHRLIADQSQIGRRYIAKIPALFAVKPIAAPSETVSLLCMLKRHLATNLVRRPIGDLLATSIKPF